MQRYLCDEQRPTPISLSFSAIRPDSRLTHSHEAETLQRLFRTLLGPKTKKRSPPSTHVYPPTKGRWLLPRLLIRPYALFAPGFSPFFSDWPLGLSSLICLLQLHLPRGDETLPPSLCRFSPPSPPKLRLRLEEPKCTRKKCCAPRPTGQQSASRFVAPLLFAGVFCGLTHASPSAPWPSVPRPRLSQARLDSPRPRDSRKAPHQELRFGSHFGCACLARSNLYVVTADGGAGFASAMYRIETEFTQWRSLVWVNPSPSNKCPR